MLPGLWFPTGEKRRKKKEVVKGGVPDAVEQSSCFVQESSTAPELGKTSVSSWLWHICEHEESGPSSPYSAQHSFKCHRAVPFWGVTQRYV